MKIVIAAVGRLKDGPERALFNRYEERLLAMARAVGLGSTSVVELAESKASSAQARKTAEAADLLSKTPEGARVVALDEKGQAFTSMAFTQRLEAWRDGGVSCATFLVGGPDGHGRAALERADQILSLGAMTLPHGLARVILIEQLYRAATILAKHPYHRS